MFLHSLDLTDRSLFAFCLVLHSPTFLHWWRCTPMRAQCSLVAAAARLSSERVFVQRLCRVRTCLFLPLLEQIKRIRSTMNSIVRLSFLFSLFLQCSVLGQRDAVTCGSTFKFQNQQSGDRLHSHEVKYGSGSGQQVCLYCS